MSCVSGDPQAFSMGVKKPLSVVGGTAMGAAERLHPLAVSREVKRVGD